MQMCMRNGINIYYVPIDNYSGRIAIDRRGEVKLGGDVYKNQGCKFGKNDKLWWKVVEKLYVQEYMKLPENLKQEAIIEVDLQILLIQLSKGRL